MSQKAFINAMTYVDDHILEQYMAEEERLVARKPLGKQTWFRLTAAAACVALLAGSILLLPKLQKPGPIFTAQDVQDMMPVRQGPGTSSYSTTTLTSPASCPEDLGLRPVIQQETITVYKNNRVFVPLDETAFRAATDSILGRLAPSMGIAVPKYTVHDTNESVKKRYEEIGMPFDPYLYSMLEIKLTDRLDNVTLGARQGASYYYFELHGSDGISLDRKMIQVDSSQTDEELLKALESIRKKLFSIFGLSFEDVVIDRSLYPQGLIRVYFYNTSDETNTPKEDLGSPRPSVEYIQLSFSHSKNQSDNTILPCSSIIYKNCLIDADDIYTKAEVPMLTLEEAEVLLKKGYVFGGYGCPICMSEQDLVDFENYDFVGLKYMSSTEGGFLTMLDYKNVIPFYVFYKATKTHSDGKITYAYTYVPAIEIQGLDEFFEQQFSKHQS